MPSGKQSGANDIKNHWSEIKSQVLSHWNKLSAKEVEQTHGSKDSLGKLVKSKYGNDVDFDHVYERICRHFIQQSKKKAAEGFIEPDDVDEEGMTRFDDINADYTGLAMSETGKTSINQNPNINTAPDEFKPNQDPHTSQDEDITLGRSNSSANTTSPSALFSSGVIKL